MEEQSLPAVAVLGTGSIGSRHLRVLSNLSGVSTIAIPIRSNRQRELQRYGYHTCKDIQEASEGGAALCIIATDTSRHLSDGISAIDCSIDILVEKPLCVNVRSARLLRQKIDSAGLKMFVGCTLRFSQSLNTFRRLLDRLGRLHSVRIECESYLPEWRPTRNYLQSYSARPEEGGVLRDLIHEIDYAGWLYGWPGALQASLGNLGRLGINAEEAAYLMWETPERCVISMSLDYLSRPARRCMRASGEWGMLEWDGIANTVTLSLAGEDKKVFRSTQTRDEMLLAQDLAFIEACHGDSSPGLTSSEDGVKALAICDTARRAAVSRREEKVDYP